MIPSYGRIISLEPYSIISKINEEVKIIHVLEGAEVVKGQKLIELENKNIKRLIARYEAEILYSKKNLKLLNEELSIVNDKLKRFLNLKENKVISNDLFDDLRIKKINLNKQVLNQDTITTCDRYKFTCECFQFLTVGTSASPRPGSVARAAAALRAAPPQPKAAPSIRGS